MTVGICAFADEAVAAGRLAQGLGLPLELVDLHRFPDGESLPVVRGRAETVLFYRSLDRPDAKIMPLLLAADAWRGAGARRVVLVAPYLCYMRQDARFATGQPLSRDVVGAVLGPRFDRIVTVEPHLHRTLDLEAVFDCQVTVLSAAATLAGALAGAGEGAVLVGPDEESGRWTAALADRLGAPHITLRKVRHGDRSVGLELPHAADVQGRRTILVDDICSSGATLAAAARLMIELGADRVEAAVVHALFDRATADDLKAAGIARLVATDSCGHLAEAAPLAPVLAAGLSEELTA